jgi:hypothetical protein
MGLDPDQLLVREDRSKPGQMSSSGQTFLQFWAIDDSRTKAVTSNVGDVRRNMSLMLPENKLFTIWIVNPSLEHNRAYTIHDNDCIIVHTCHRVHKVILGDS